MRLCALKRCIVYHSKVRNQPDVVRNLTQGLLHVACRCMLSEIFSTEERKTHDGNISDKVHF